MDIAMTDDPANLDTILSELTNRDPEIRKAARSFIERTRAGALSK